jgi:hypothetical protein
LFNFISKASLTFTFEEKTGAENPFDGIDFGGRASPDFIDIDGDNDFDAFIGTNTPSSVSFYRNDGDISSPTFTQVTGSGNPLDGVSLGVLMIPMFVDIDNDNDFDVFIGLQDGTIDYFENINDNTSATLVQRNDGANPLSAVNVGLNAKIGFVDIDGDDDFDVFIGTNDGDIDYFENTNNNTSATFEARVGASNPFDGVDLGDEVRPTFLDMDDDGDYDVLIGELNGNIFYFENIGNASSPTFTQRTGSENPFNGVDLGAFRANISAVDINDDGNEDVFIGDADGFISFFSSSSITPVLGIFNVNAIATGTTGATFSADVADGGASTTYTFDYGTSSGNYSFSYSNTLSGNSTTVNVGFEDNTNLTANTQYFVRASATNSETWTEIDEISFWTLDSDPASHSTFAQVGEENTSIEVSFDAFSGITNADGYLIIRSNTPFGENDYPTNSNTYNVNDTFGNSTVVANIYDNSATSYTFNGLAKESSWKFALIPYSLGDDEATANYLTSNAPSINGYTIPTLGEWGIIAFGSLMLLVGVWYIRRLV